MADEKRTTIIVLLVAGLSMLASGLMYLIGGYDRAVTAAYGGVFAIFIFLFGVNLAGLVFAERARLWSVAYLETIGKTVLYGCIAAYSSWWFFYKILLKPDWMQNRQIVFLTIFFAAGMVIAGALMTNRAGAPIRKGWLILGAVVALCIGAAAAAAALLAPVPVPASVL